MACLVDTSVLVRTADRQDDRHDMAARSLQELRLQGERLVLAPQNIVEFWAVATRPRSARGLGLTLKRTLGKVSELTEGFEILPEGPAIFDEWLSLAERCAVAGKQVHDARLAAWMRVHEIAEILTFNVDDFRRYPGVTPIHPREVAANGRPGLVGG